MLTGRSASLQASRHSAERRDQSVSCLPQLTDVAVTADAAKPSTLFDMSTLLTLGTTVVSGLIAAMIALGFDGWRSDRARRKDGRQALQEMQRVLADLSASLLAADSVIDETPLETLSWGDVALARRSAYPYRDLLPPKARELVSRSTIPFDRYSDLPYDVRQPVVDAWATELDDAIEQAFASWTRRCRMRLADHKPNRRNSATD